MGGSFLLGTINRKSVEGGRGSKEGGQQGLTVDISLSRACLHRRGLHPSTCKKRAQR